MEGTVLHKKSECGPQPGLRQQQATRALFFIAGFGIAAWAPLVPFIKVRFDLAEDMLGLLLLCIGLGSAVTMPLAGILVGHFGCRRVLCVAGAVYAAILFSLSLMTNMAMLIAALLLFGSVMGILDVAVNIHAVLVEKAAGKRIMSGMHGLWSAGGFAGAAAFGLLRQLGLSPVATIFCLAVTMVFILFVFGPHLLAVDRRAQRSAAIAFPQGIVVLVGTLCAISFLAEGAVLDWSGVFLTALRALDLSLAGCGYAAFSAAMLIGRLGGDRIVRKLGDQVTVIGGSILAAVGFGIVIAVPLAEGALLGFFLVGIGSANIVPVFYSLLGNQKIMPITAAVSAVTTMGYLGILMGPALIGFVAQQTSLLAAFAMLAGLLLLQAVLAKTVYRKTQ